MDKEIALLAAVGGRPVAEEKACFQMFREGKCDVKGCVYNHSKAMGEKIALRRIQEILKSPMVDSVTKESLRVTEKKILERMGPVAGTGAKVLLNRSR